MENKLSPYECQFTVEERKRITAHTLQEVRKSKGMQQKEVANYIQVKPTTYNTYETGRTEPPIEVLVRLSYLYEIPIDHLVQKQRLYKTSSDLEEVLKEYKNELKEIEKQLLEDNDPTKIAMKEALEKMVEQLIVLNQQKEIQDAINKDVNK